MLSRSLASTLILASSLSVFWACDESSSTDAATGNPDAATGNPDATTGNPDATTGNPDATADAGVPADGGGEADAEPTPDGGGEADAAEMDGSTPAPVPHTVVLSATGHDRLYGAAYDELGYMYAVGVVSDSTVAPDFAMMVAKFTPAGEVDTTFGSNGVARLNVAVGGAGELARGIVLQEDGKIVISGSIEHAGATDARDRDVALVRFQTNGDVDTTFGVNGVVTLNLSDGEVVGNGYVADGTWGLAKYANDDLLVFGTQKAAGRTDLDFSLVRLDATTGDYVDTFDGDGIFTLDINNQSANARSVTILADGSAVAAGYMSENGVVSPVIFKVNQSGALDTTFGVNGVFNETVLLLVTEAYGAAVQGNNFVTSGYGRNDMAENIDWVSLRITDRGTLDPTYGTNGYRRFDFAGFNDNARTLVVLPDNRTLMVGGARTTMDNIDNALALLTVDGALDPSFNGTGQQTFELGGVSDFFWGAAISPDQRTVGLVGLKGVAANSGLNDDAVVYFMPMPQ